MSHRSTLSTGSKEIIGEEPARENYDEITPDGVRGKEDCCANCGVVAVDEIKLKKCLACHLVRYCSIECQKEHRPKHKRECKQRAAELRDEILFKQPESSHLGECPICCLPLPLGKKLSKKLQVCCGKLLCLGCACANTRSALQQGHERICPFCREKDASTEEEVMKRALRRAESNDPLALQHLGRIHYDEEDYENAFRYWARAAEEGCEEARFQLGSMYMEGKFVEEDTAKCIAHWVKAAVRGHVVARFMLGIHEWDEQRFDRAVKHWIISASLGHDNSIKCLTTFYKEGHVSKDDFAKALLANQAAVDAMKSPQREFAEKMWSD